MLAVLRTPITPKENKKKNSKKKKKESHYFKWQKPWDVKVFGKNTTYQMILNL